MLHSESRLRFHRLIEHARAPQRADRAAAGTLPTRAYRYCDAVTSAAGYGWWVFSPMDLQLIWDGHDIFWYFDGAPDWIPLSPAAQFPNFSEAFDDAAPARLRGCAPPFLTALPEPGTGTDLDWPDGSYRPGVEPAYSPAGQSGTAGWLHAV